MYNCPILMDRSVPFNNEEKIVFKFYENKWRNSLKISNSNCSHWQINAFVYVRHQTLGLDTKIQMI